MPRIDHAALVLVDEIAHAQRGLITAAQLSDLGLAGSTIRRRARQGGPWRRVLPAVYAVTLEPLTFDQRVLAASLYAGRPSLITGGAALRRHGIRAAEGITPDEVHVLVPHGRKRASTHFVHVQRARYWPAGDDGHVPAGAPVVRAAVDACRTMSYRSDVAALLTELVRDGHTAIADLEDELRRTQRRQSALMRDVLTSLRQGVVSAPEDDLFRRWQESGLPPAVFNAELYLGGEFLAKPDVYVAAHGLIVEVDSAAHHSSPGDWDRTMRRHARLTALGFAVLHCAPVRIRTDWPGIEGEIRATIGLPGRGPVPGIRAVLWTERRERGF